MMSINATLIGQMITFAVFVWFTMKYVWPPITKAMQDREKRIADGLAAAERGQRDLELAKTRATEIVQEARQEATRIVDAANKRAATIVDEAKVAAREEGQRLINHAKSEITQEINEAKRQLQTQVANVAISIAEKLVQKDIDMSTHQQLLDKAVSEI